MLPNKFADAKLPNKLIDFRYLLYTFQTAQQCLEKFNIVNDTIGLLSCMVNLIETESIVTVDKDRSSTNDWLALCTA